MGEDAAHQVAFGEDADYSVAVTHQHAADSLVPHQANCLGHGLVGTYLKGRSGIQSGDAVDLQVPGQVHYKGPGEPFLRIPPLRHPGRKVSPVS